MRNNRYKVLILFHKQVNVFDLDKFMTSYISYNKSLVTFDKRAVIGNKRVDFGDRCVATWRC